jgi:hypothetical protein
MKKNSIFFFVLISFLFIFGKIANAASLNFSPSSGTHRVGDVFPVTVYVSTDQAMNATEGKILFPANLLQVTSVSDGSVIAVPTPNEPSFSNVAGTINFGGINMGSGYQGPKGKVLIVNFKIKAKGTANLSISKGSVLANDGNGTEIISSTGSAKFKLLRALIVADKDVNPVTTLNTVPVAPPVIAEVPVVVPVPAPVQVPVTPTVRPIPFYFQTKNIILGDLLALLVILLLITIYFWRRYYKLRHIVDQIILEERDRLFKLLSMDIAEKGEIAEKIKAQKKLTDEELKVITEVEKKHQRVSQI